jgi:hypothetical protein
MMERAELTPVIYQIPRKPTRAIEKPTGICITIMKKRRIRMPRRPVTYFLLSQEPRI